MKIIRNLIFFNFKILSANGAIYRKDTEAKLEPTEFETNDADGKDKVKSGKVKKDTKSEDTEPHKAEKTKPNWIYISPAGNKYIQKADKSFELIGYYKCITAHDAQTKEVN